jgi:hypothetical protein
VINPQDGHILCDPYSAIGGFGLWILRRNGIANSATSRPKEILVEFSKVLLPNLGGRSKLPPISFRYSLLRGLAGGLGFGSPGFERLFAAHVDLNLLGLGFGLLGELDLQHAVVVVGAH